MKFNRIRPLQIGRNYYTIFNLSGLEKIVSNDSQRMICKIIKVNPDNVSAQVLVLNGTYANERFYHIPLRAFIKEIRF